MDTPRPHGDHVIPPQLPQPTANGDALPSAALPLSGAVPAPGGHSLPQRFSSQTPARRPRRRRPGLVFGSLGAVLAVLVFGGLQLGSNLGYDSAADRFQSARANALSAQDSLRGSADVLGDLNADAQTIIDSDSGLLVPADTKAAVTTALGASSDVLEESQETLDSPVPRTASKPLWFWELFAATGALQDESAKSESMREEFHEDDERVRQSGSAVADAVLTMISTASEATPAFESAHISAKNLDVIALRDATASAQDLSEVDPVAVDAFISLDDAAERVVNSEQEELAEKSGPLQGARLEIEAFARSLAPGVLLDFDWAPIVNGYGGEGSMGGYTSWWYDDPGYATIQLSNSVAEQWPADRSKALVAHEVGHAISVKCQGMYDDSTADSIEKWATGWAIGMGFADDANGVWAYGYPPQSYIDAAMGCR